MAKNTTPVLTSTSFKDFPYKKIAEGKVRDLYEVDNNTLLFVASDRISAYDVIMGNGVPHKGAILTLLSAHWFKVLPTLVPNLRTHFLTLDLPGTSIPSSAASILANRSMQVRRLKIFPVEAIVRGYITGSAWKEYKLTQTVHNIPQPAGLIEASPFPSGPIYTPSTKAEAGQNDQNIHPSEAVTLVGEKYAKRIEDLAIAIYTAARDYAYERGIVIADSKFEFGLDEETDEVVLVDEVMTPDSSRFWPKDRYEAGSEQESYDKQFLRDWLTSNGLKGKEGVNMPEDIVRGTEEKYQDAFRLLTGKTWESVLAENL
ncbi:putative phosphoribosylaminoimidazole-succinocarboxamide synthase [Calycina marina]|uniref:Phosphoribosylaminoimidazole-succinocarboxamide synthase n=1 Tax=Calycina marina TaxID=1763456 RepID=A0A9P8CHK5_9HELO|nr:putative phosphoribosylaminoimidazole-succinocarboxamide synthase [Calycina marina]